MFEVARPCVPVSGSDAVFPVHRIYCVGQNYAAHAREMGSTPERESPFYFMKPADAVVSDGSSVPYPPRTADLHHEIELVVAIGRGGRDIRVEDAAAHVFGYAVGIDLTRRDLQAEAKQRGRPWDAAKGFDHSAPVSAIRPAGEIGHPTSGRIWLQVNDELRQNGDLEQMIWNVPEIVSRISMFVALQPGDLVFTGTPAGVGPLRRGDRIAGGLEDVGEIRIRIGE